MPRKRIAKLEERMERYLQDYDLDDVNKSNDLESLKQLCLLDMRIEKIHDALSRVGAGIDPQKWRSLTTSLKDLTNSSSTIQNDLGIVRKKRRDSEEQETALKYIDRLKEQAKTFIDRRLKRIVCPNCNVLFCKYHFYVREDGEPGAIAWEGKELRLLPFLIKAECPKCHATVIVDETEKIRVENEAPQ